MTLVTPETLQEPKAKLLDQMRQVLRLKHLSYRTKEAYLGWVRRFLLFHDKRHPKDMGATEIRAFLIQLAVTEKVAASTQNNALNALLFLYRYVLRLPFPELGEIERGKRPQRLHAKRYKRFSLTSQVLPLSWLAYFMAQRYV